MTGKTVVAALVSMALLALLTPSVAMAHCDGLDGPVVTAAKQALTGGNVDLVLVWVQPADEPEIRDAFKRALVVRKLSPEAQQMADTYFFETLVRVHRAGEGAPYTGLKPAGRDLGPAIPAADKALVDGKIEPLVQLITEKVQDRIRESFRHARETGSYDGANLRAGREYVAAYVKYIHLIGRLYLDATLAEEEHAGETETAPHHEH